MNDNFIINLPPKFLKVFHNEENCSPTNMSEKINKDYFKIPSDHDGLK